MGRIMGLGGRPVVLAFAVVTILAWPGPGAAFCLKNESGERLEFRVDVDGRGNNAPYRKTLSDGKESCCDWQKVRCNRGGKAKEKLWFEARKVVGLMEWICKHEFYASDEVRLIAHQGASGCRWGRASGVAGADQGLVDKFMRWLNQ